MVESQASEPNGTENRTESPSMGQSSSPPSGNSAEAVVNDPPKSLQSAARLRQRQLRSLSMQQQQQQARPSHLALPLSMRLMKQMAGLCCLDHQSGSENDNQDLFEHPELSLLLNYDLQSLYCVPVAPTGDDNTTNASKALSQQQQQRRHLSASPLVLAPMTMSVVVEEEEQENEDEDSSSYNEDPGGEQQQQQQTLLEFQSSPSSSAPSSPTLSMSSARNGHLKLPQLQLQQKQQNEPASSSSHSYSATSRQTSSIPRSLMSSNSLVETIVSDYIAACRFYGVGERLNAGVLTTLRFSLPCMRITGYFHDADMLALAEILFKYINGPLRYLKRLDFSVSGKYAAPRWSSHHTNKGMHSHGAFTLAKVLQMSKYIEEVYLQRNRIGPYGASAIFIACSTNPSIKKLNLRRCRVCERGARVFAELVATSSTTALEEIDLSANYLGVKGSLAIERALLDRMQLVDPKTQQPLHHIAVDLEGNHVLQEVMNSVTHGLGVLLAVWGSWLMTKRVRGRSDMRYSMSVAIYSMSLIVLYTSSTLYHSFFSMQNTKYIFEVFDKCAIYILIAGSYTPFLQIVLGHEPVWSAGLLIFLWCCCFLGIAVEAFYPTWEHKMKFSLTMYLGMGWCALLCIPEISRLVPDTCVNVMILGGVGYTSGVPFFVRNNNLDHAVWHLFVLAGSIFHWCGVYFYVVDFVLPEGYVSGGNIGNLTAVATTTAATCLGNETATALGNAVASCVAAAGVGG